MPPDLRPITHATACEFYAWHHYLGGKRVSAVGGFHLGWYVGGGLVGAISYHGPSVPESTKSAFGIEEQMGIYEIGRLALEPEHNGRNCGSRLIGRSLARLRRERDVRAVLTYAEARRHVGYLYQATGFIYCGLSPKRCDFFVGDRLQERGRTRGVVGEWRPRARKHRYVKVFDASLGLVWQPMPYPKGDNVAFAAPGAPAFLI